MSLVAYAFSSDEESADGKSDDEQSSGAMSDDEQSSGGRRNNEESSGKRDRKSGGTNDQLESGGCNDSKQRDAVLVSPQQAIATMMVSDISDDDECDGDDDGDGDGGGNMPEGLHELNVASLIFSKLPMPKSAIAAAAILEEEDDEFLSKKATSPPDAELEKPPPPPPAVMRGPVKITIPSLDKFADVKGPRPSKAVNSSKNKASGLLGLLPVAKSERNFAKSEPVVGSAPIVEEAAPSQIAGGKRSSKPLIPDTVRNRRPAYNTEGVDGVATVAKRAPKRKKVAKAAVNSSDTESSDDENPAAGDFFSLYKADDLPEVNPSEIQAMVDRRAVEMAMVDRGDNGEEGATMPTPSDRRPTVGALVLPMPRASHPSLLTVSDEEIRKTQKMYQSRIDAELKRSRAGKRRQNQPSEYEIVEISSDQVLPNRDEWMRTALASSTSYQPTGQLTNEEPAPGTRRKHQITYLAHRAKANEAELQAMWSANRQSRRDTQNKYGF